MNLGLVMTILLVCWFMFRHYRDSAKCRYCGGEWYKHEDNCPLAGSGTTL